MCVHTQPCGIFLPVMTTIVILLGSKCNVQCNKYLLLFLVDVGLTQKWSHCHCFELSFGFNLGEKVVKPLAKSEMNGKNVLTAEMYCSEEDTYCELVLKRSMQREKLRGGSKT